jgi:FkbM family methyltransferase
MKAPRLTYTFFDDVWKSTSPGFYVEIGAWDGRKKNSTIVLEKAGWDGVAIEASPPSFELLKNNRKCRCLNVAVYDYDGEVDYALFPDRPEWNGIIETYKAPHIALLESKNPVLDNRTSSPAEIIKIKCMQWSSLNLPNHIDYLQIDTEGSEMAIMNCINWNSTTISYICLEDNNYDKGDMTYTNYMTGLGYKEIARQGVDFLWKKV